MKITYKSLSPSTTWVPTSLILGFIIVLQSCAPTHDIAPEASKADLIVQAQALFKKSVANATARKASTNPRDIDISTLFPEWDKNNITQNSKGQDVLGVFISITEKDFWEADFIFDEDTPFMYIKKYSKKEETLTIYDGEGKFLKKGKCIDKTSKYYWFLTREMLSKQARVAQDGEEPDPNAPFFNGEDYSQEIGEVEVKGKGYDPIEDFLLNLPTESLAFDELLKRFEEDVARYNMAQDWLLSHSYVLVDDASVPDFSIGLLLPECVKRSIRANLARVHNYNSAMRSLIASFNSNGKSWNLKIYETTSAEMASKRLQPAAAYTGRLADGTGWNMFINTDIVTNQSSEEFVAAVLIHELFHIISYRDGHTSDPNNHKYFYDNDYIDAEAQMLQRMYGIDRNTALSLSAYPTIGSGNTEEDYGLSISSILNTYNQYQTGQIGTDQCR